MKRFSQIIPAFIAIAIACSFAPVSAIQTFPGGVVRNEKTLFNPDLVQNGTVELSGTATFAQPAVVTVPFVNTDTVNPSLWATAPEITVSLVRVEGNISGGYKLDVFNVNHNTFSLSIRPNKQGVTLRNMAVSYLAVGHRSKE